MTPSNKCKKEVKKGGSARVLVRKQRRRIEKPGRKKGNSPPGNK